jgi:hypothetical protein
MAGAGRRNKRAWLAPNNLTGASEAGCALVKLSATGLSATKIVTQYMPLLICELFPAH